ncbi:MAG: hypothetical protein COB22_03975 [Cycloclasticus sp.]|nr:MAG: hypothetical protein COB22_03975 [Cycloclasticus sp.]
MLRKYCLILVLLTPTWGVADNVYESGEYVVYYNAFTADSLPTNMATAYGILRSKYKGVLNISVQKKRRPGELPQSVTAKVNVEARNLVGQLKELEPRKITEGDAIYYISEFRVSHKERITFDVEVLPTGETQALELKIKQQFYTD